MLKTIVRATTVALALFCGLDIPDPGAASAHTRHAAGSAHGARMHGLHSQWFGFSGRRHSFARHSFARHARRFAHGVGRHRGWRPPAHHRFAASPGRPLQPNPLLMVASRYVGAGRVSRQRGPWCRDFINTVARKAGYHLANSSRRAIDALRLGHRVASPRPGDLVVMRHHVTIFAGYGGRGLIGLGGNQGRGGVTYSSFSRSRVVGYVRM